jgi:septal ring factor EnvC (AmiA/AmiB activator)
LPAKNAALTASITALRAAQTPDPSLPAHQTLPLSDTQALLAKREAELALLNHQLEMLDTTLPITTRREDALRSELALLETRTAGVMASAREAQRRKERNELGADELEERGRWWRGVEAGVRGLVG